MSATTLRRHLSDEELGHIADTMDKSPVEVAEALGRSLHTVRGVRRRLRNGWAPQRQQWSAEEDQILDANYARCTSKQLAAMLPGRTEKAVQHRLNNRGILVGSGRHLSPQKVGKRPLLAKTCPRCGVLLSKDAYRIDSKGVWESWCKGCRRKYGTERQERPDIRARLRQTTSAYYQFAQGVTLERATKQGQEWTESETSVLTDPELTTFSKALMLGRTFYGTSQRLAAIGFVSPRWVDDVSEHRWVIDNPNDVEAVKRKIQAEMESHGIEWKWDWND